MIRLSLNQGQPSPVFVIRRTSVPHGGLRKGRAPFSISAACRKNGGQRVLNQMQLHRGVLHRAPVIHAQLPQDGADVGFHGGQLDTQNLPDLRVALVVAQKPQHVHLRRRQRFRQLAPAAQEVRILRRLFPRGGGQPLQGAGSAWLAPTTPLPVKL